MSFGFLFLCYMGEPVGRPNLPVSDLICRDVPKSGGFVSTDPTWPLLRTSLFCCPSIFAQALRAAIVAAELPLRGKLRAEAITFLIDQRILEVIYQCLRALFIQGLILCWRPRIAPCSTRGQNCRANRACSAGCVAATSNPSARAARAVPRPTNYSKRGASRRQTPISRVSHYC